MPRKVFTAGEVLAAADVNEFLMDQAVMTFAGTAARGSAIPTPTEGMVTFLADTDTFEFWNGTAYASLAPATPTLEFLVIGGGGGGGERTGGFGGAGGGGAGGYRNNVSGELSGGSAVAESPLALILGTYQIVVGAGGAGATATDAHGSAGTRSAFNLITSQGGGGGTSSARGYSQGGSGGGGANTSAFGTGITKEGFNGGNAGTGSLQVGGGGGGGAGAIGVSVVGGAGGGANGGAGLSSSITGSSVPRGGGGGGGGNSGSGGTGGTGGGGNGTVNTTAGNGTVNTGGGGGGTSSGNGGNGGSGIVIFTVPTTVSVSFTGGVTQTNSTVGSKQVYVVTATSTTSETVTFA